MIWLFVPPAVLLFFISPCHGLNISMPDTTPLGADTPVTLISQEGDLSSFFLKTSRVDGVNIGNFYMLVSMAPAPLSTQVILNFATPHQYIVQALTREELSELGQSPALATSNAVQVVSGSGSENLPASTIAAAALAIWEFCVLLALLAYRLRRRLLAYWFGTKTPGGSPEEFKRDGNPDVENAAFEDLHSPPGVEGRRPVSRNVDRSYTPSILDITRSERGESGDNRESSNSLTISCVPSTLPPSYASVDRVL